MSSMADLKIKYKDLETAIQLSKEINQELTSSYQTVTQLKTYLQSAKWSGKTKVAFESYLDIVNKYHKDLRSIMEEHEKAVTSLKKSIDNYNSSSEVASIKGL